jgi:esterase/lipase superfamily enzyme
MASLILDDPKVDEDISIGTALQILKVAAKAGEPEAYLTLSQYAEKTKRPIESFELSMVASEIGGPTYSKLASDIRFQVCNESVDAKCEAVPVFFITNRRVKEKTNGVDLLNELAPDEQITLGWSQVSIPTQAEFSAERKSWQQIAIDTFKKFFGSSNDPKRPEPTDVSASNEKLPGELADFLNVVKTTAVDNGRTKAFVYIHGFNNSFDDAARRMALLSEQFKYPGVPIVLSWASAANGTVRLSPQQGYTGSGYLNDIQTVNQSCRSFRGVLEAIVDKFGAGNVMVMGHSMGGKLLYYMLTGCPAAGGEWSADRILNDVILAAPDIDVSEFRQSIDKARSFAKSFTIYVSANDAALKTSQELVGGRPRVGQGGENRFLVSGITTIDAFAVENQQSSDLANHAYVFDTPQVKHDLSDLLHGQQDPDQRVCPKQ